MRHNSISDSLWRDPEFKALSNNGKLLMLCLLTSPLLGFSGACYATDGLVSEYSGLTRAESVKAITELVSSGFILASGDYLIIRNYLKFNAASGDKLGKALIKDVNSLPQQAFDAFMSIPVASESYLSACDDCKLTARYCNTFDAVLDQPQPKPMRQPVAKNAITESEEIARLRGYADVVLSDFPDVKHAKNTLTTEQYQKLLDKYGMTKLTIMQKVYFGWKAGKAKAPTTTDYGTLIAGTWVAERADEELSKQPHNHIDHAQPQTSEWTYKFPRPAGFENWSRNDKSNYITSGGKTMPNGGSNA